MEEIEENISSTSGSTPTVAVDICMSQWCDVCEEGSHLFHLQNSVFRADDNSYILDFERLKIQMGKNNL